MLAIEKILDNVRCVSLLHPSVYTRGILYPTKTKMPISLYPEAVAMTGVRRQ
jgi:hypothetical protein